VHSVMKYLHRTSVSYFLCFPYFLYFPMVADTGSKPKE
jgi:hypothetical protein